MPTKNGSAPAALRIEDEPKEPLAAVESSSPTFELTGESLAAFKDKLGHECKPGDKYTLEVTATSVTPSSIAFSLDNVESEYEEEPEGEVAAEGAAAPSGPSKALTYA